MASVLAYVPGDSLVHRMHPLTKLIWLMGALVLSLFLGPGGLAVAVIGLILLARYCRVWKPSLGYYRFLAVFAVFVLVLSLLFTREGTPLWPGLSGRLGWLLAWTDTGLRSGLVTGLRMLFVAGVFPVFLGTTQPRDIVTTLVEQLHVPYDYAFMFTSALRFIPTLIEEMEAISQAQKARGFRMRGRGPIARVRAYAPVAVPLVLSSLSRAERMAVAMETRGYGSGTRTYYYQSSLTKEDITAMVLLFALIFTAIVT